MTELTKWSWVLVGVILVLAALPIITIWSLNVVFGLGIVYSLKTWLAVLLLLVILSGDSARKQYHK